jgi:hypothetical protein
MTKQFLCTIAPLFIGAISINSAYADLSKTHEIEVDSAGIEWLVIDGAAIECGLVLPGTHTENAFIIRGPINCAPGELSAVGAGNEPNADGSLSSAALNIINTDTTSPVIVKLEGDIDCNGNTTNVGGVAGSNASWQTTDLINTIGIYIAGNGIVVDGKHHDSKSEIENCNVGVEVGYTITPSFITPSTPPVPSDVTTVIQSDPALFNLVQNFSIEKCNSGFRIANADFTLGRKLEAECGYFQEDPYGLNLSAATPMTFDGFVMGIKALYNGDDLAGAYMGATYADAACVGNVMGVTDPNDPSVPPALTLYNESLNSINFNRIEDSQAAYNYNGVLLANEMDTGAEKLLINNSVRRTVSKYNMNNGFYVVGTGHEVGDQHEHNGNGAFNNGNNGVEVSLNQPDCNPNAINYVYYFHNMSTTPFPNFVTTNIVKNNKADENGNVSSVCAALVASGIPTPCNGVAAIPGKVTPLTRSPTYPIGSVVNAGTVFEFNKAFGNGYPPAFPNPRNTFDLVDDNGECASGESQLSTLNFWRKNHGEHIPPNAYFFATDNASCVGNQLKTKS